MENEDGAVSGESETPVYRFTVQLASLAPPPPGAPQLCVALQGAMSRTPATTWAAGGVGPIPESFSPENVGLIHRRGPVPAGKRYSPSAST